VLVRAISPQPYGLSGCDRLMAHRAHLAGASVQIVLGHIESRVVMVLRVSVSLIRSGLSRPYLVESPAIQRCIRIARRVITTHRQIVSDDESHF
jgi:hypothetical protein